MRRGARGARARGVPRLAHRHAGARLRSEPLRASPWRSEHEGTVGLGSTRSRAGRRIDDRHGDDHSGRVVADVVRRPVPPRDPLGDRGGGGALRDALARRSRPTARATNARSLPRLHAARLRGELVLVAFARRRRRSWLCIEFVGVPVYAILAVVGLRRAPWLLAVGIAAHGVC